MKRLEGKRQMSSSNTIKQLVKEHELTMDQQQKLVCCLIWAFLLDRNWDSAEEFIKWYPLEAAQSDPIWFLKECWLHAKEKKAVELPKIAPATFLWEKRQIYRRYILFYHCSEDREKSGITGRWKKKPGKPEDRKPEDRKPEVRRQKTEARSLPIDCDIASINFMPMTAYYYP